MRVLALTLLAGLLAVTAPPAAALCADDGNGGCQSMAAPAVAFAVHQDCGDAAVRLCILHDDGNASILAGNDLHLNVTNHLGVPIAFELFLTQRVDDAVDDTGEPVRQRADLVVRLEDIAPGATRYAKVAIDGNASMLRAQALSADDGQAELDLRAEHVMYMTGLPEGEGDGEVIDPAADHDGRAGDADADTAGKDAPYLGLVLVVALLAAFAAFRRD